MAMGEGSGIFPSPAAAGEEWRSGAGVRADVDAAMGNG